MITTLISLLMAKNTDQGKNVRKVLPIFKLISIMSIAFSAVVVLFFILKIVMSVGIETFITTFLGICVFVAAIAFVLYSEIKSKSNKKK